MVFFIDEEIDSNDDFDSSPEYLISQQIIERFGGNVTNQIVEDALLLNDKVMINIILCCPIDADQDKEHVLLEKWEVKQMKHSWQCDDQNIEKLDWNVDPLHDVYVSLPLYNMNISPYNYIYGCSSVKSEIVNSVTKKSIYIKNNNWNSSYEISVTYTNSLSSLNILDGKIIVELDSSSSTSIFCDHSSFDNKSGDNSPAKPPRRSKPIPIHITGKKTNSVSMKAESMMIGSPRFPNHRKRSKSTNTTNRMCISPSSDSMRSFVGSLQESLISGRIASKSTTFKGFSAKLCASSPHIGLPAHLKIPFETNYYHIDEYNQTPYAASIFLPKDRFRIASEGSLQITIFNPSGTPIKVFVVPYNLSHMKANSKTFIRQITRNSSEPHILQYAIQFNIICTKSKRLYLYKNIRVVFPHRIPDEHEKLEILCLSPDKPQYFKL